jgi:transposase
VLAPNKTPAVLANKITELSVRLNVTEEQIRLLREENERLKQIAVAHEKLKGEHQQTVERKVLLEEEVRWLKAQYYGRSTQATDAAEQNPDQAMLFNEAEVLAAIEAADEAHRERTTKIAAHERKRSADAHRKAIPEHFPRIEIEHDLEPDQKMCTKCDVPHPLTRIGQEIRECYRFEPPKISVEQHIRPTYVCEERHDAPITAPAPPVILPKSMASPSLLAHVANSKFKLGLPLYRVCLDLNRYRMDVTPGTLGTWMSAVGGEKVVPVVNLIRDALFTAPFMHIDETPLQILRSDKATGSDHYIVVRAGGPPGQRIILYDYLASRTTVGLKQFFMGPEGPYQGKLVSDGLERYDDIAAELKLLHFGCLTHCRTMFFKARKVSNLPSIRTLANAALEDYIGPVYRIERQIKELRAEYEQRGESLPLETVLKLRQEKSKPILEKFKAWIDEILPGTPPNSALGKALGYATRQWPKFIRHLDHPEIPVDNNYTEQQIKHFATGRKAWLFSYDASSAQASANLFSLVMTCRINDIEPYAYLNHLFEHLPSATTVEQIEALLPWNVTAFLDEQKKKSPESAQPTPTAA